MEIYCFHGTQKVELQIVSAVAITQSLPSLKLKLIPGSIEEEFFNSLMNPLPEHRSFKVIPISAIEEKLVFMHFKGEETAYVSLFPNRVESD